MPSVVHRARLLNILLPAPTLEWKYGIVVPAAGAAAIGFVLVQGVRGIDTALKRAKQGHAIARVHAARRWLGVVFVALQHFMTLATTKDDRLVLRSARTLVLGHGKDQEVVRVG